MTVRAVAIAFLAAAASSVVAPARAAAPTSTVYVTAYRCALGIGRKPSSETDRVSVDIYNLAIEGKPGGGVAAQPAIEGVNPVPGGVQFQFQIAPGTYEAAVNFENEICNANGPLVVMPGLDRHLFVAGQAAVADWHASLAIAGIVAAEGMSVSVVTLDHAAQCGDDPRLYSHSDESGVVDGGAYYASVYGYDRQDHTIAIELTGALFTQRAVLITEPLGGKGHGHDFVVKNITLDVIRAAALSPNKFACVPGF
jgi:hypothetical protein